MSRAAKSAAPPPQVVPISEESCQQVAVVMEVIGRRWSGAILLALGRGAERFTDIERRVQGLSGRMLTVRLRELENLGLVMREVTPTIPVSIRYRLTERGVDLLRSLQPIARYAEKWEPRPEDHG